ncbi:unnamed protein product [Lymnaea stagnalis]|uniref:Uncharacterized protein n=1 Tax=Lymnaea stagnalis TaxID=6523 RepID=A0AAV2HVK5_LYMST
MNLLTAWIRKSKLVTLCRGLVLLLVALLLFLVWLWHSPAVLVSHGMPPRDSETPERNVTPAQRSSHDLIRDPLDFEELSGQLEQLLLRSSDLTNGNFTIPCRPDGDRLACRSNCSRPLNASPKLRLWDLATSAKLTLSDEQVDAILALTEALPTSDYILLSASSHDHYHEMQSMFYNLHTVFTPQSENVSLVLLDIGLTEEQRKMTEKHCRCQVLDFPFYKFPRHSSNRHCYTWKPLIILSALQRVRKVLIYQDSSIRWLRSGSELISRAQDVGMQLLRSPRSSRVPMHALEKTFDYFEEKPCAFSVFPELHAGFSLFKPEAFAVNAILKPWARCALEASCMCPVFPKAVIGCSKRETEHGCHRFDQSCLSIITGKLFNEHLYKFTVPNSRFIDIKRFADHPGYFNST